MENLTGSNNITVSGSNNITGSESSIISIGGVGRPENKVPIQINTEAVRPNWSGSAVADITHSLSSQQANNYPTSTVNNYKNTTNSRNITNGNSNSIGIGGGEGVDGSSSIMFGV